MDPIFNINTESKQINIKNEAVDSIIIDFDTFISNVTDEDKFMIYKFKIPFAEFDADTFESAGGEIMNYTANTIFMGNQIFAGGYEIDQDPEPLDISTNIAQGTKRIIDLEVEQGYIFIYQCIYTYAGILYSFTITNTVSETNIDDSAEMVKDSIAIRYRNQVRRGPIRYMRKRHDNFEVEQDLKLLYNNDTDFKAEIEALKLDTEVLFKLYDLEDRISILLQNVDLYGYGIGKYGRNGGYGL